MFSLVVRYLNSSQKFLVLSIYTNSNPFLTLLFLMFNRPVLHKIKKIKQETPTVKSFQFEDSKIAKEAKPGQFLMVWVPRVDEFPISIASVSESIIEIAVANAGEGTKTLHEKKVGDWIGLRGPIGTSFNLEGRKDICAVVGGYGSAPVRFLAESSKNKNFTFLMGAKSEDELLYKDELEKYGAVKVATDDGSLGFHGTVIDRLKTTKLLEREMFDLVVACCPEVVLKKVCDITTKCSIPTQVSVERIVKCASGFGGCCTIGKYRVCKEGPVFDKEVIMNTEFGKWTRNKAGTRVPIKGIPVNNFDSVPLVPYYPPYDVCLQTDLCGLLLSNPSMNVAGMGFTGEYLYRIVAEGGAGAIVTKSIGLRSRDGYDGPNFIDDCINAMGLPGPGIVDYRREIEDMKAANVPIFASIYGETPEEAKEVAASAIVYGANGIEGNVSCPHTSLGSVEKDPELVKRIAEAVVSVARPKNVPVFVKISANADYVEVAKAAVEGGASGITAINTKKVMPMNKKLGVPILGSDNGYGGLSGEKIRKLSIRVLKDLYAELDVPIINAGGISWDYIDRFEYGASACQIGTATIKYGLGLYERLNEELGAYIAVNGYDNVKDIIGIRSKR